jgi:hypothetical protein
MRSHVLLLGAVVPLAAPLTGADPALALAGGTESTQAYSFIDSFQLDCPDHHGCGVEVLTP